MKLWSVPAEWPGETAFVVAGGTSVTPEIVARLSGRRVVAVNSSFAVVPFADFLVFGDSKWWHRHRTTAADGVPPILGTFKGRIVTCDKRALDVKPPVLLRLERRPIKEGLAERPNAAVLRRTSVSLAINVLAHLGIMRIGLIGVDLRYGAKGRTHHHAPHCWPHNQVRFEEMAADLKLMAKPLKKRRIEVVNLSPISRLDVWPKATLDDFMR